MKLEFSGVIYIKLVTNDYIYETYLPFKIVVYNMIYIFSIKIIIWFIKRFYYKPFVW